MNSGSKSFNTNESSHNLHTNPIMKKQRQYVQQNLVKEIDLLGVDLSASMPNDFYAKFN